MPLTVDTSRMSVEQLRALSAEKQQERTGKKKEEKEWSRHAMALEDTLMQGFPAQLLTDEEGSGFPKELSTVLKGTADAAARETYSNCWKAVEAALENVKEQLAAQQLAETISPSLEPEAQPEIDPDAAPTPVTATDPGLDATRTQEVLRQTWEIFVQAFERVALPSASDEGAEQVLDLLAQTGAETVDDWIRTELQPKVDKATQGVKKMLEEVAKEKGKEATASNSYFDPDLEQRRLHGVYRKIERLLQTLADCETARTHMNEHSRSGSHRKILKKWRSKRNNWSESGSEFSGHDESEEEEEEEDSADEGEGDSDHEQLDNDREQNKVVAEQTKQTLSKLVADFCYTTCNQFVTRSKDSSLQSKDLKELAELKLEDAAARSPQQVRRLSAIIMGNLLKEPDKHAGILPALAVFMRCCVAVHTVPCPTYRRLADIKLNETYGKDGNWWGIMGPRTCESAETSSSLLFDALTGAARDAVKAASGDMDELFPPSYTGQVKLAGIRSCGVSFVEVWKYYGEWRAAEQIEIHRMRIYQIFERFYKGKLETVLEEATDLVQTGIEYGSVVSWDITGGMWVKVISALHPNLEAKIEAIKLGECPNEEKKHDCISLLPDLIAGIRKIAAHHQALSSSPASLEERHQLYFSFQQQRTPRPQQKQQEKGKGTKQTGKGGDKDRPVYQCQHRNCPHGANYRLTAAEGNTHVSLCGNAEKHGWKAMPLPLCEQCRERSKTQQLTMRNGRVLPLTGPGRTQAAVEKAFVSTQEPTPEPETDASVPGPPPGAPPFPPRVRGGGHPIGMMQQQPPWAAPTPQMQQTAPSMQMPNGPFSGLPGAPYRQPQPRMPQPQQMTHNTQQAMGQQVNQAMMDGQHMHMELGRKQQEIDALQRQVQHLMYRPDVPMNSPPYYPTPPSSNAVSSVSSGDATPQIMQEAAAEREKRLSYLQPNEGN